MDIYANPVGRTKEIYMIENKINNKVYVGQSIDENPNSCEKLSVDDIEQIKDLLEFSYLFNGEIARRFNVEVHLIEKINSGKKAFSENIDYPIRDWKSCGKIQFTYEEVTLIIEILQTTNRSFRDIASQFNCQHSIISQINQGTAKKYKRKNLSYPLRQFG